MSKVYRVRITNFPSYGEKRWCNYSMTEDINQAYLIRDEKEFTSTRIEYIYTVEEYIKRR